MQQEDVWFIKFDGEEYGPYKTEREAMLFAIDAAHKLGEQGEETQVLQMDENRGAAGVDLWARPVSAQATGNKVLSLYSKSCWSRNCFEENQYA